MPLTADDEQVLPTVSKAQVQFVLCLDDTHKTYARFISALLIPSPSHAAFFHDLRCFRSQPQIISLLSSNDRINTITSKETTKQTYREVTTLFLQPRWSHPWCRKVAGNCNTTKTSAGWRGAEWTPAGRRMGKREKGAEEQLHRLLLPIWVIMRARMFPGNSIVDSWWALKQENDEAHQCQSQLRFEQGITVWLQKPDVESKIEEINLDDMLVVSTSDCNTVPASNNPFRKGGDQTLRPVKTTPNMREMFWTSAEAEKMQEDIKKREQETTRASSNAFRLVATAMLLTTAPKRKLRRLLQKA